jgi:carbon-monoxide dehydrogenase iron sulfur subunit
MQKDPESGLVYVDMEKCIGCWTCVMVCPFAAVAPDPDRKKAFKCDLCKGLDVPACVAGCPNQALLLVEFEEEQKEEATAPAAVKLTANS